MTTAIVDTSRLDLAFARRQERLGVGGTAFVPSDRRPLQGLTITSTEEETSPWWYVGGAVLAAGVVVAITLAVAKRAR